MKKVISLVTIFLITIILSSCKSDELMFSEATLGIDFSTEEEALIVNYDADQYFELFTIPFPEEVELTYVVEADDSILHYKVTINSEGFEELSLVDYVEQYLMDNLYIPSDEYISSVGTNELGKTYYTDNNGVLISMSSSSSDEVTLRLESDYARFYGYLILPIVDVSGLEMKRAYILDACPLCIPTDISNSSFEYDLFGYRFLVGNEIEVDGEYYYSTEVILSEWTNLL